MRTKTLLLTAALSAAGIATSMAQVYSVNAVGYVNTPLVKGFSLISNPLNNTAGNTVENLFKNGIQGTIPGGLRVYKFIGTGFDVAEYDDLDGNFGAKGQSITINPGEGAFVKNPGNATLTVTFVGEVPQGNLSHATPAGFSIQASEVPQEGTADALGLKGENGDTIYMFNEATQNYEPASSFDDLDNAWSPALKPLQVGEAFFLKKVGPSRTWTRTFSVNG